MREARPDPVCAMNVGIRMNSSWGVLFVLFVLVGALVGRALMAGYTGNLTIYGQVVDAQGVPVWDEFEVEVTYISGLTRSSFIGFDDDYISKREYVMVSTDEAGLFKLEVEKPRVLSVTFNKRSTTSYELKVEERIFPDNGWKYLLQHQVIGAPDQPMLFHSNKKIIGLRWKKQ